jgi:DNA-3-methyladenine glycosylase
MAENATAHRPSAVLASRCKGTAAARSAPPGCAPKDAGLVLPPAVREAVLAAVADRLGPAWYLPERRYYHQPTETVARGLLGGLLLHATCADGKLAGLVGGCIVETEAYLGRDDPASHAAAGVTQRTEVFFREGGLAYVFRSYGLHHCFNVITLPPGEAGCVLIRALEPLLGIEAMAARRRRSPAEPAALCSGPGKLCQALGIDGRCNGWDLTRSGLLVLLPTAGPQEITRTCRIGITKAADRPLRFCLAGSEWLSGKAGDDDSRR